jgi:hypothetical protein
MLVISVVAVCSSRSSGAIFPDSGPITSGLRATLCGGIALAPAHAPLAVKRAIWAQINCAQSPIATAAATAPFTIAVMIVLERYRMLWAVLD